jgi:hypothetical protein
MKYKGFRSLNKENKIRKEGGLKEVLYEKSGVPLRNYTCSIGETHRPDTVRDFVYFFE